MREENFWCKKPRYSEVRVIARRVIARYDCICSLGSGYWLLGSDNTSCNPRPIVKSQNIYHYGWKLKYICVSPAKLQYPKS